MLKIHRNKLQFNTFSHRKQLIYSTIIVFSSKCSPSEQKRLFQKSFDCCTYSICSEQCWYSIVQYSTVYTVYVLNIKMLNACVFYILLSALVRSVYISV